MMKNIVLVGAACWATSLTWAQPYPPEQLQLRAVFAPATDLGVPASSTFNPRYFDDLVYVSQVNAGAMAIGRYASGSPDAQLLVDNTAAVEHRMLAPFRGALRSTYMIGSSSGATSTTTFSRYNFDGSNRVDANTPDNMIVEGFDWVDDDTVISTVYTSGNRKKLYLSDVVVEPFALRPNTTWNANGYVTTSVSTRIRNVRVGDVYSDYAYYGDSGQNDNPNFYALNLATGQETLLGNAGQLTGSGSFGIWSVVERAGYLYVQTTDNGIQVYKMEGPTTLGALEISYPKETLDWITGYSGQYYGIDVTPDGTRFLLGASQGQVFEFGYPNLVVAKSGNDLVLSWPAVVIGGILQSSSSLSPAAFADLDPQPVVSTDVKWNTATVPASLNQGFFRLFKP